MADQLIHEEETYRVKITDQPRWGNGWFLEVESTCCRGFIEFDFSTDAWKCSICSGVIRKFHRETDPSMWQTSNLRELDRLRQMISYWMRLPVDEVEVDVTWPKG